MRKLLVILLCITAVTATSCRNKKEEEKKRIEMERIRQEQDAARRADEERMVELQMRARQDSIAAALAMANLQQQSTSYSAPKASACYVVVGSFLDRSNASAYLEQMQETFGDAAIVRKGRWSMVTVGGKFNSFRAAARTVSSVTSQLGGEDDDADDEDSEEYSEDEEYAEEEYTEDEYAEEEEEDEYSEDGGEGGQAWVMCM